MILAGSLGAAKLGRGMKRVLTFFSQNRCRWLLIAIAGAALLLFEGLKGDRALMNAVADRVTTPMKQGLAALTDVLPFSVAEAGIMLAVLSILAWLVKSLADLVRKPGKGRRLLKKLLTVACAVLIGWSSLSLLWGVNYYTDTFQEKSGLRAVPVSVDKLASVTAYFAGRVNENAARVNRNGEGGFAVSLDDIFAGTQTLGETFDRVLPFLPGRCHTPKRVFFSEFMSEINCTGFFFPYSGEANINVHSPAALIPATIAHELAHQRAVASEQEANFIAVLTSVECGIAAYEYSGWLLGYIYLNNALYSADEEQFRAVFQTLSAPARQDIAENGEYWSRYDTPVASLADAITDQRLKNYGQEQGIQSYGAVVDLLVARYGPEAGAQGKR